MEIERFDWFIKWTQTRVAFGWLDEHSGEKTFKPGNVLEINPYFALTSCCNTIDQSNNAFLILNRVFFCRKMKSPHFDLFIHWLIKQMTNTYRNYFSRSYKNLSKSHVYNKRQTTDSSWVFLRIENKQIKTVQNNNYDLNSNATTYFLVEVIIKQ